MELRSAGRAASAAACAAALGLAACAAPIAPLDAVEPMPALSSSDASSSARARRCAEGEPEACTALADQRFLAGSGAEASALFRRAADLARRAESVSEAPPPPARTSTADEALEALAARWEPDVVPAAAAHGHEALARAAAPQLFGPAAVARWRTRRARASDAYRMVHTWRTREGGGWAGLVWIGDLSSLAAPRELWELTFGWMGLDFAAYVDDTGRIVALSHFPEG